MANSKIQVSQGSGTNVATVEITESAEQKHLTRVVPQDENGQPISWATSTNQITANNRIGDITETAPANDTASSGLNGRLQRIAQRLTTLITNLGTPFQAGGSIGNTAFGVNNGSGASAVNIQDGGNSITVDATSLPLPTGASTSALQTTANSTLSSIDTKLTSPLSVAQSGTWNINAINTVNQVLGTHTPLDTLSNPTTNIPVTAYQMVWNGATWDRQKTGQQTMASSMPVTIASNQSVIPTGDGRVRLGAYYQTSGAMLVQAAADAATAGRAWLINPIGSTVKVVIRKIKFSSQLGSALVAVTSPRISIERVTFTGTASGATISAAKRKTSDATQVSSLRTASTGLTLTAGSTLCTFLPIASATAVGYTASSYVNINYNIDEAIELVAGEGIVIRQPDAGTASDTRRYTVEFLIEEY